MFPTIYVIQDYDSPAVIFTTLKAAQTNGRQVVEMAPDETGEYQDSKYHYQCAECGVWFSQEPDTDHTSYGDTWDRAYCKDHSKAAREKQATPQYLATYNNKRLVTNNEHGAEVTNFKDGGVFVHWHFPCNSYVPPIRKNPFQAPKESECICFRCGWERKRHKPGWVGQRVS